MSDKDLISQIVEENKDEITKLARDIWDFAELAYNEYRSKDAIMRVLRHKGFRIEEGIADIPTAFLATCSVGSGKPNIGFLAEYDALDGLSQKACEVFETKVEGQNAGHGCGHNLLGAGTVLAAIAVKEFLERKQENGTVMVFGTPAEEGAGSKQFIARAGYFNGVDFIYTWHPSTYNEVSGVGNVAIMGANFHFSGIASHAGSTPELGRSALDAVELMNVGCNYLREHMIDQARIHYAYSNAGGTAPNVVPAHATIKYEVRAPKVSQMQELFARIVNVAKGAALMTDAKMEYEITMAFSDYVANRTLGPVLEEALKEYGAPEWSAEDYNLASSFLSTYNKTTMTNIRDELKMKFSMDNISSLLEKPLHSDVFSYNPYENKYESASTDVGDVSYVAPTANLYMATAGLGTPKHSWQNTAFSASDIGFRAMIRAGEILALASIKTARMPELIKDAKEEVKEKNGGKYICPLPEYVNPPINRY